MLFRNNKGELISIIQNNYSDDYYYYKDILTLKGIELPKEEYNILSLCKCGQAKEIKRHKKESKKEYSH